MQQRHTGHCGGEHEQAARVSGIVDGQLVLEKEVEFGLLSVSIARMAA